MATAAMSASNDVNRAGSIWAIDPKTGRAPTLQEFASSLVAGGYVKSNEVLEMLSAKDVEATFPLSLSNSALKIYPIGGATDPNTIFITTRNWTPYLPLDPKATPYGDKLFIVMRSGGDGAIYYQATQATNTNATGIMTTNDGGAPLK